MEGKKRYFALVLFLFIGLMIFTFANPAGENYEDDGNNIEQKEEQENFENEEDLDSDEEDKEEENIVENINNRPNQNNQNNQNDDSLNKAKEAVEKAEKTYTLIDVNYAEQLVNNVTDTTEKGKLQERLNEVLAGINVLDLLNKLEDKTNNASNKEEIVVAINFRDDNEIRSKIDSLKNKEIADEATERLNNVSKILDDNNAPRVNVENKLYNTNIIVKAEDDNEFKMFLSKDDEAETEIFNNTKIVLDGTYKLRLVDKAYNEDVVEFVVDTTAPVITVSKSNNDKSTNKDVLVTIKSNEEIQPVDGWTEVVKGYEYTKLYSENGKYSVTVYDLAGNEKLVKFEVKRLDKVPPMITVRDQNRYQMEVDTPYVEKGYSAWDEVDKDVTSLVKIKYQFQALGTGTWRFVDELDTSKLGTYKIIYIAYDKAGNSSEGSRVVQIVEVKDTTPPEPTTVEILTLNAFHGNTEYANNGKEIRVFLTFKEELLSKRNSTWGTHFGTFNVNNESVPLRMHKYDEENKEYIYLATYKIEENAVMEEGVLNWSVEIFGDLSNNTIDPITKTINARAGRTKIIYDNTVPGDVSTSYSITTPTNGEVTVTIKLNEQIVPVEGWTLSEDKKSISKSFSENVKGNVTVYDLAGNSKIKYYSIKNIDKNAPEVDTLRVKGIKDNKGTTNFQKIKIGDTFQVILTTKEELGKLPIMEIDNKEIFNVKVNTFETYYQYIFSYKIPEDTSLKDGEKITFKLKDYTDKASNPGKDLTNNDIKIGNGQDYVIFDKTVPEILIDRNIVLNVGEVFVDDINEKVFDNVTSVDKLYIGGGWGTFKNTSVPGVYYLNYKVMDEAGNYNVATRKITVLGAE